MSPGAARERALRATGARSLTRAQAFALALALAAVAACKDEVESAPIAGAIPEPIHGSAVRSDDLHKAPVHRPRLDRPEVRRPEGLDPRSAEGAGGPETARGERAADEPPRRDLSRELRGALGDVSSCFSSAALPPEIALDVSVVMTENGIVTRATVEGPGIPGPVVDCVRTRAEAVRLAAPLPPGTGAVTTRILARAAPPAGAAPGGAAE